MSRAAEWRERRRLLVAQAALQRAQLAYEVQALRSALPAAGSVLTLAAGVALVVGRLRAGGALRGLLLRAWRVWRRQRRY